MKENLSIELDLGLAEKRLCSGCVGEAYLKSMLENTGEMRECSYCGAIGKTLSVREVAECVDAAIEHHYQRIFEDGSELPWHDDTDQGEQGELVSDIIADRAHIAEEVAEDIRTFLKKRECLEDCSDPYDSTAYDTDARYERTEPNAAVYHNMWVQFENRIKTESRFSSRRSLETLDKLFKGIKEHKTSSGERVVVEAGPTGFISELYRARVFQSGDKFAAALKRPDMEMGPPPTMGVKAGRMNACGISVFYASRDVDTAIAEVRPPVGSRVVVAKFKILSPLRLLDVGALRSLERSGSIFNPEYLNQLQQANFLKTLSSRISRPVMPDDEALEYLATQVIADYLAEEMELHGLIYPSVQTESSGGNVVLFPKAVRVKQMDLLEGTTFDVDFFNAGEEVEEENYHVWEAVPPGVVRATIEKKEGGTAPTLEVDLASIQVHHIMHARFSKESYNVTRQIVEKIEPRTGVIAEF